MKTYRVLALSVLAILLFVAGCGENRGNGSKGDAPQTAPAGMNPNDMGGHGAGGGTKQLGGVNCVTRGVCAGTGDRAVRLLTVTHGRTPESRKNLSHYLLRPPVSWQRMS